jgi:hypothetical protein
VHLRGGWRLRVQADWLGSVRSLMTFLAVAAIAFLMRRNGTWWQYVIVLVAIAIVIQPGGIRGPRHAARTEEKRSRRV